MFASDWLAADGFADGRGQKCTTCMRGCAPRTAPAARPLSPRPSASRCPSRHPGDCRTGASYGGRSRRGAGARSGADGVPRARNMRMRSGGGRPRRGGAGDFGAAGRRAGGLPGLRRVVVPGPQRLCAPGRRRPGRAGGCGAGWPYGASSAVTRLAGRRLSPSRWTGWPAATSGGPCRWPA